MVYKLDSASRVSEVQNVSPTGQLMNRQVYRYDTTGRVTKIDTFDPSGKVSSATITEPPFAGTATATCISSALKRATIAPFGGLPGTVSKTFSIL
jgi:hypothetical protein